MQHFPFEHIKFEFIKQASITVPALGTRAVNNFSIESKKCGKQASLEENSSCICHSDIHFSDSFIFTLLFS